MKWGLKIGVILSAVFAALLLTVVVSASGGNPPPWWDNPQGYSSWRHGGVTGGPVVVNAYSYTVSILVENVPMPMAHKEVWMQVEWGSDDAGVVVSEFPSIAWSYVGCEGPWEDTMPMLPVGPYVPELPSEYPFGQEYSAVINPQPACELIEVTFVDKTPTTPGNTFTLWYNIQVQTLCFDNVTSVDIQRLLATSLWPYALLITGIAFWGGFIIKRRKRSAT